MAYSAKVQITRAPGSRQVHIEVYETECAAASEWSTVASDANEVVFNGVVQASGYTWKLPANGAVLELTCEKVSGSCNTVQPRAGKASGWSDSTSAEVYITSPASAFEHAYGPVYYGHNAPFALYGNSKVDTGSDNVIRTHIRIEVEA